MKKPTLARKLAVRLARLEAARSALAQEAYRTQRACSHSFCYETPVQFGEFLGALMPRRICAQCRLEEEGSIYSGDGIWSEKEYRPSAFKGSVVLGKLNRDEFYALRLPVEPKKPAAAAPATQEAALQSS